MCYNSTTFSPAVCLLLCYCCCHCHQQHTSFLLVQGFAVVCVLLLNESGRSKSNEMNWKWIIKRSFQQLLMKISRRRRERSSRRKASNEWRVSWESAENGSRRRRSQKPKRHSKFGWRIGGRTTRGFLTHILLRLFILLRQWLTAVLLGCSFSACALVLLLLIIGETRGWGKGNELKLSIIAKSLWRSKSTYLLLKELENNECFMSGLAWGGNTFVCLKMWE